MPREAANVALVCIIKPLYPHFHLLGAAAAAAILLGTCGVQPLVGVRFCLLHLKNDENWHLHIMIEQLWSACATALKMLVGD